MNHSIGDEVSLNDMHGIQSTKQAMNTLSNDNEKNEKYNLSKDEMEMNKNASASDNNNGNHAQDIVGVGQVAINVIAPTYKADTQCRQEQHGHLLKAKSESHSLIKNNNSNTFVEGRITTPTALAQAIARGNHSLTRIRRKLKRKVLVHYPIDTCPNIHQSPTAVSTPQQEMINDADSKVQSSNSSTNGEELDSKSPKMFSSKYHGVCWNKTRETWLVRIPYRGERLYVGNFRSEIEGALAYDKRALELFGDHAVLNFPSISYSIKSTKHGKRRDARKRSKAQRSSDSSDDEDEINMKERQRENGMSKATITAAVANTAKPTSTPIINAVKEEVKTSGMIGSDNFPNKRFKSMGTIEASKGQQQKQDDIEKIPMDNQAESKSILLQQFMEYQQLQQQQQLLLAQHQQQIHPLPTPHISSFHYPQHLGQGLPTQINDYRILQDPLGLRGRVDINGYRLMFFPTSQHPLSVQSLLNSSPNQRKTTPLSPSTLWNVR